MINLLLTGVVKPYGVDDDYGEALCTMELLNNQVTREQGIHSPRSNNLSFGLYLMAENINVPTTVLDFPSWQDFTREIDSGKYSHVGISFIVPNVMKARRMAQYIRQNSPGTKIILGGHGTAIPELEELLDYDDICHGEGVSWLRSYFGEEPGRPVKHPILPTSVSAYIYGAPLLDKAGIIIPGVGCVNSCRFCATSHKFEKKYTPFLKTGREIFDVCLNSEETLKVRDFGLMDENFFKDPARASQLLAEMENGKKPYTFATFSSAETIQSMGVDFLVRLGVNFLWIGVESKANIFEKTRGIDIKKMISELQNHGITVLASVILFLEHHDKTTLPEDVDWAIELGSDLMQFMQFTPVPGTRLFREYMEAGVLIQDFPWQKQHGQDTIFFKHPHFTLEESHTYLKAAFIQKYQTQGPGVLNMAWTALNGYRTVKAEMEARQKQHLAWNPATLSYSPTSSVQPDEFMRLRLEAMRQGALKFRPILNTTLKYAPNEAAREKCRRLMAEMEHTFGPPSLKDRLLDRFVRVSAFFENRRIQKNGQVMRQPPKLRTQYREQGSELAPGTAAPVKIAEESAA